MIELSHIFTRFSHIKKIFSLLQSLSALKHDKWCMNTNYILELSPLFSSPMGLLQELFSLFPTLLRLACLSKFLQSHHRSKHTPIRSLKPNALYRVRQLIRLNSYSLKVQVHISKIILNSMKMILDLWKWWLEAESKRRKVKRLKLGFSIFLGSQSKKYMWQREMTTNDAIVEI